MNAGIDCYIQLIMTQNRIPGLSIAIVREGEPILVKGYGLANVEHSVPASEKTVYEIASVGKIFTATATMMLAREGAISLDDAIADCLSNPPEAWHPVTILSCDRAIRSSTSNLKLECRSNRPDENIVIVFVMIGGCEPNNTRGNGNIIG
ncbi:MAG: beta-lactamase family protein [Hydrococcus sp. Prado102]|jgi:hypothetical protein|nr:beta-lactamase family protein [Hydrococcus sp. Prado102]